jgi:hypothetical protein
MHLPGAGVPTQGTSHWGHPLGESNVHVKEALTRPLAVAMSGRSFLETVCSEPPWLSHFLLPWTHVLHRPTHKICDPACLVLSKGSPAGVLHASRHAPPLFSLFGITGLPPVGPNCYFQTGSWLQLATRFERRSADTSFPIPLGYKLVSLSLRLRGHLGRASPRPTQGDSAFPLPRTRHFPLPAGRRKGLAALSPLGR